MERCSWAGCGIPVTYSGRGRPPKYCPDHAKASKQRSDKARPGSGHARKRYPQCCLDAQAARVRVRTCAQHQQWRAFYGRSRKGYQTQSSELRAEDNDPSWLGEIWQSQAYRITVNHPDDYLVPDPGMEIEVPAETCKWCGAWLPPAKSGYDAELETMTRRYLALAPNGKERDDDVTIIEPDPPDIGYWQKKCADGRRRHKSDAFRYPPEMNRGAGWCAKLIP
jgi:hypothetical protein